MINKGEILTKLYNDGTLQYLVDHKIIAKKMHNYFRYYREVQFLMLNYTLNDAVLKAADKLGISERTVWRALKTIRG